MFWRLFIISTIIFWITVVFCLLVYIFNTVPKVDSYNFDNYKWIFFAAINGIVTWFIYIFIELCVYLDCYDSSNLGASTSMPSSGLRYTNTAREQRESHFRQFGFYQT